MTNINLELVNFLRTLNNIKGASFIGIKDYYVSNLVKGTKCVESGYKNININVGVNRLTQKNNNRNTLAQLDKNDFYNKFVNGKNDKFTFEIFNKAYNSIFDQLTEINQKLSNGKTKVEDTTRQKAIKDTFTYIVNGIKQNNRTKELYVCGNFLSSSKSDKKAPIYNGKVRTKRTQTLIQDILKDELNLVSFKYRSLFLAESDKINTSKISFDGKELYITL
jgi:hypothetical protein